MNASVSQSPFGQLPDGQTVHQYTLTNPNGLVLKLLDFGGIITEIHTPDREGQLADIVLGFDQLGPYLNQSPYFGALIGRYANRIRAGRFTLDHRAYQLTLNHGPHHLHGGSSGFDKQLWHAEPFEHGDSAGVTLTRRSADGEQGYPGTLDVTVLYQLTASDELVMTIHAVTDQATPVNLTQHSYFNLAGRGQVLGHILSIDADAYTEVDETLIPTGIAPVAGTPFDFRTPHAIGERIDQDDQQLRYGKGYDHNLVLNPGPSHLQTPAARVFEPGSGRVLELYTQEPGLQFYSGNELDGSLSGKGRNFMHRGGFCLEPQHFPDSPNQPSFPDAILRPGQEYVTMSRYRFRAE